MVGKRKCRVKDRKNEERESVGLRIEKMKKEKV